MCTMEKIEGFVPITRPKLEYIFTVNKACKKPLVKYDNFTIRTFGIIVWIPFNTAEKFYATLNLLDFIF